MKIMETRILLNKGAFAQSSQLKSIMRQVELAIKSVEWPPNSGSFILHDQPGKARNQGSGVKPIKLTCMAFLKKNGWALEAQLKITSRSRPGPMDAALPVQDKHFCVEWETGNISS